MNGTLVPADEPDAENTLVALCHTSAPMNGQVSYPETRFRCLSLSHLNLTIQAMVESRTPDTDELEVRQAAAILMAMANSSMTPSFDTQNKKRTYVGGEAAGYDSEATISADSDSGEEPSSFLDRPARRPVLRKTTNVGLSVGQQTTAQHQVHRATKAGKIGTASNPILIEDCSDPDVQYATLPHSRKASAISNPPGNKRKDNRGIWGKGSKEMPRKKRQPETLANRQENRAAGSARSSLDAQVRKNDDTIAGQWEAKLYGVILDDVVLQHLEYDAKSKRAGEEARKVFVS